MTDKEKLYLYMHLVNKIDDYLEYRYKSHTAQQVRDNILGMIDTLTKELTI